jgi:hypothetical protein
MRHLASILFIFFCKMALAQNVGIGESNPTQSKLQVKTTDSAVLLIQNTATPNGTKTALFFKSDNNFSGSVATVKDASATYRMGFYTFGGGAASSLQERMSILDGGNVGIGTSNPTAKLDVAGTLKIADGTQGVNKVLTSDATGNATWQSLGSQFGYKKCTQLAPLFGGTFSGNFIVPDGVTEIMVELWGAGSGGSFPFGGAVDLSNGGTSGGYARTVQPVVPSQSCSYSIGVGSSPASSSNNVLDGGSTTFNFATTSITAFGGGGRSANSFIPGNVKSGTGTVSNLFVLNGNTGDLPSVDFKQKSATVFVEIRKFGSGGQTPAIIGAPIPKAGYQYLENGVQTLIINDSPSVMTFPGTGGFSIATGGSQAGGNGMILIWYN